MQLENGNMKVLIPYVQNPVELSKPHDTHLYMLNIEYPLLNTSVNLSNS